MLAQFYKKIEDYPVWFAYIPLGIHWCVIFALTSLPGSDNTYTFKLGDKIDHFAAYFVLSIFMYLTMIMQNKKILFKEYPFKYSFIIVFFYGVFDELHQIFIPGRSCDIFDLLADVLGSILALLIMHMLYNKVTLYREEGIRNNYK